MYENMNPMNANPYYNAQMPYTAYGNPYMGMSQNYQPQLPKMTQILTPEEINTLKSKNTTFNINVDPIDITRACCVHRENGAFKTVENNDGSVTCTICGETFTPIYSTDDGNIEASIKQVLDIINTIKLSYVDLPSDMGRELFPFQELIKKIPALYKIAMNNLNKYTNIQNNQQNNVGNYGNAFATLGMMTSGYGSYYPPQPYGYNNPYQQPAYDPNQTFMGGQTVAPANIAAQNIPMTPPTYGYNPAVPQQPVPPSQNPFNMYAAQPTPQVPQYQPQVQAPAPVAPQAYQPQTQPVPPAPVSTPAPVPPAPEQVTVTESIKV